MESFSAALVNYRLKLLVPVLCEGAGASGLLAVERGHVRREFQVVDGCMLSALSNDPREHLTQLLADLNILNAVNAAQAFERAEASQIKFGKYLVEQQLVDKPRLVEAMMHKAREAFVDCYLWENGEVSFTPGRPVVQGVPLSMKLSVMHRDGMARVREWQAFRGLFPADDQSFTVNRERAGMLAPAEDQFLLHLAEAGACLGELLAASREGRYAASRRIARFYRQGVLAPVASSGVRVGQGAAVDELLAAARQLLEDGRIEEAVQVAEQVLERAPVPEAHALYRAAEQRLAEVIAADVLALEGRLCCEDIPLAIPDEVTADDLYLHAKLRAFNSLGGAVKTAAMGELAAFRSVKRLIAAGLLTVATPTPRRESDPAGVAVVPG